MSGGALTGIRSRLLTLVHSRGSVPAVLVAFLACGLLLLPLVRPWRVMKHSTWPLGFEAGRIARNLIVGVGYASPFLALPSDNFLVGRPSKADFSPATVSPALQELRAGEAPTAWITPPTVFLWYLLFRIFGTYTKAAFIAFFVVQMLVMTMSLLLTNLLVTRLRGKTAGFLALVLILAYPSTWYFCLKDSHGTIFYLGLLMLSLFTLERFLAVGGDAWLWAYGMSGAIAVLTEPASVLFSLWVEGWVAWLLLKGRRPALGAAERDGDSGPVDSRRRAVRFVLVTSLCCLVVWGPWFVRNLVVLRAPILFKSNFPMELYYGNNPEAPENPIEAHLRRFPTWSEEERLHLLEIGEPAYARLCLQRAADFVRQNPGTALRLTLLRMSYYWSYNPHRATEWRALLTLLFHLVLGLWLFATVAVGREGRDWFDRLCVGFFVLFPIGYYLTHFLIYRYRYPLEVLLLIAAVAACSRLGDFFQRGRGQQARTLPEDLRAVPEGRV